MANVYPNAPGILNFGGSGFSCEAALPPMRQGDTFIRPVVVDGVDLSVLAQIRCSIRESYDDTTPLLFLDSLETSPNEARIEILNSTSFRFRVPAQVTETLEVGRYKYDVELVTADTPLQVYTLLEGRLDVVPEVTKE